MPIRYVFGSIFDSKAEILVNPVNCVGVSGAGLAMEFKRRYPKMYEGYRMACKSGILTPGRIFAYVDEKIIVCFPTKNHWMEPSRLEYIESGLKELARFITARPCGFMTAIPAIGCGLGGLRWSDVKPLIESNIGNLDCDIEVYEPDWNVK